MEIWHRITYNKLDAVDGLLADWGIECVKSPLPGDGYILTFEIAESDERWPQIAELVRAKPTLNIYNTVFTREEILSAEWVRLIPAFEKMYPQPERRWKDVTYANVCPKCGVSYSQVAPFRLAKEAKLGRNDFLCLGWTYTLFGNQRVWEKLRDWQVMGLEKWPALLHLTQQPSNVVSQLVFPIIATEGLSASDRLKPEECPECRAVKYASHLRGYLHIDRKAIRSDTDFQVTSEWFGSGGYGGFHESLASHRVARLAIEEGWRGISMKPVILT